MKDGADRHGERRYSPEEERLGPKKLGEYFTFKPTMLAEGANSVKERNLESVRKA